MSTQMLAEDERRIAQPLASAPVRIAPDGDLEAAISVLSLVKRFGTTTALDGLDLTVRSGEVHGFLGPNGAGKTTTIRVLLGLLRKDGGEARLLGGDPWHDAVALHRRLAYVPGEVNLWPNLTGGEVIDLLGRLRGGLDRNRRAALLERFQLDPTKKIRAYSKGNRQKVALVAAFASDVELYLLDEPTSGLDPLMEIVFQGVVRELRESGRTVLLSSHVLAEVASTGLGRGRRKSFAHRRLMPSHSATATCPPSSGRSGMRLKTNSAMFSEASSPSIADTRLMTGASLEETSPAMMPAPTTLSGPFGSRG